MSANSSKSSFLALINSIPNNHECASLEVYLKNGRKHFTTWMYLRKFSESESETFMTTRIEGKYFGEPLWMKPTYEVRLEDVKEIDYNWKIYMVHDMNPLGSVSN